MSLINDMLKNLEKRHEIIHADPTSSINEMKPVSTPEPPKHKPIFRWIIVLLIAVLVVIFLKMTTPTNVEPPKLGVSTGTPSTTPAVIPASPAVIPAKAGILPEFNKIPASAGMTTTAGLTTTAGMTAPLNKIPAGVYPREGGGGNDSGMDGNSNVTAALQSMTVMEKDQSILLQFTLDQPVLYQVLSTDENHTLTLLLPHTALKQALPPLLNNAYIQNLMIKQVQNDLLIVLHLSPNTELSYLDILGQTPSILSLSIAVSNNALEPTEPIQKKEISFTPEQLAEQHYKTALTWLDKDNIESAMDELDKSLDKSPNFIPARKTLATLLIKQKQYGEAMSILQEGLKLTPDELDLIKLKAQVLILYHSYPQALSMLETVSPEMTVDPEYYSLLALVYQHLGKYLLAADIYQQLLALDAKNGLWWVGLGIALESANQSNSAIDAYRHAVVSGDLKPNIQAFVNNKMTQSGS